MTGVDLSRAALRYARERAAASSGATPARYVVADASRTPFRDATFRGAIAVDVLQCVPDKSGALGEVARTLAPGARLTIATRELRSAATPELPVPIVRDHEALLRTAGFELVRREVPSAPTTP